jgi:WD40 repeat protein
MGHDGEVTCCKYSNDGMRIVSGSSDRSVKIWDSISNAEIFTFDGHEGRVNACSFSKDDKLIVSASEDKTIKIWDINNRMEKFTLKGHNGPVNDCSFSNDCKKVVSASEDKTVKIWDVETGEELVSLDKHRMSVNSCEFSRDGSLVVSASDDNSIILWDVVNKKFISCLNGHEKPVYSCSFSPKGDQIVSASEDKTLRIWNVERKSELLTLEGHSSSVYSCQYSTDGEYIVSGSADNTIKVWEKFGKEEATFKGHSADVKDCSYSYSGNQIISASVDGTIKVWMASSPKNFEEQVWHEDKINSCSFTPDSKHIVSGSEDGTIKLWDESAEDNIATFIAPNPIKTISIYPSHLESRISNSNQDSSEVLYQHSYDSLPSLSSEKTIYIVINSTFADFRVELNELQKNVFPKLCNLCMEHGINLQVLDFRWGVSEEAGLEQKTMGTIFHLIEKAAEHGVTIVINILGDRYGWRPLPIEISANEFEEILNLELSSEDRDLLVWNEEWSEDEFSSYEKGWYRIDDNLVPPVYRLKPRNVDYPENVSEDEIKYIKEKELIKWMQIESKIKNIFLNATELWEKDYYRGSIFESSDIEQKIIKFHSMSHLIPPEFTMNCIREIKNMDDVKNTKSLYIRDFFDIDSHGNIDYSSNDKLNFLKKRLFDANAPNTFLYPTYWDNDSVNYDYLHQFTNDVFNFVQRIIIDLVGGFEDITPLEDGIEAHKYERENKSRLFVGRSEIREKMKEYILYNNYPLVIHGESGSGKSALIAKFIDDVNPTAYDTKPDIDLKLIYRFIGITSSSSDIRSLLESICRQICLIYGEDDSISTSFNDLKKDFIKCISYATKKNPLIIFIDALNLLENISEADYSWIPWNLPDHVSIVLSTSSDELTIFENKLPKDNIIKINALDDEEISLIIDLWLKDENRNLNLQQKAELIKKSRLNGMPLYLKLAFEEAITWKSYDTPTDFEPDISGIILQKLNRLSNKSNHGKHMISNSLGYIGASKDGISINEIRDILGRDPEIIPYFTKDYLPPLPAEDRIPDTLWSKLYFDLEPYLYKKASYSSTLLTFSNQKIKETIIKEFLAGNTKIKRHNFLAKYFMRHDLKFEKHGEMINIRKLSELPYHQTYAGMVNELEETLSDLEFIGSKCGAGVSYDLLEDYKRAEVGYFHKNPLIKTALFFDGAYGVFCPSCLSSFEINKEELGHLIKCSFCGRKIKLNKFTISSEWDVTPPIHRINNAGKFNINSPVLDDFSDFIMDNIDNITNSPDLFVPLAANHPKKSHVSKSAQYFMENQFNKPWIQQTNTPKYKSSCVATLNEHSDEVISCLYSPDGENILTSSKDNEIKIWDSKDCIEITSFSNQANASKYSPDGQMIISASDNGIISIWDAKTQNKIVELNNYSHVNYCSFSPDGKFIVSALDNKTINLWDIKIHKLINTFENNDQIFSFSFSPDSKNIAYITGNNKIKLLEIASGKEIKKIDDYTEKNNTCSYSPDGLQIVSGSLDGAISIWDVRTGQKMNNIKCHNGRVNSCVYSPDGNRIVSVSDDKRMKVSNSANLKELSTHFGHSDAIKSCDISPDGHYVVTGSTDTTIKIWDIVSENKKSYKPEHDGSINDCSYSIDGNEIVSVSDDCKLKLWDSKTISEISSISEENPILSCAYSPKMDNIVSGDDKGTLIQFEVDEISNSSQLHHHKGPVNACTYYPSGKRMISGSDDKTINIYKTESNKLISTIKGHQKGVKACLCSPDNKYLFSGSDDHEMKIWDADKFNEIGSFITQGKVSSISLSPDGKKIIIGDSNAQLYVLEIKHSKPIEFVENSIDNDNSMEKVSNPIKIIAGDAKGKLYNLQLVNYPIYSNIKNEENSMGDSINFKSNKFNDNKDDLDSEDSGDYEKTEKITVFEKDSQNENKKSKKTWWKFWK